MTTPPPPEATRLLEERDVARASREFGRADALRARLLELGWKVVDRPEGSVLESILDRVETHAQLHDARSRLGTPDTHDFSVCVVMAGWPEDVARLAAALGPAGGGRPAPRVEVVVVDQARLGVQPHDLTAGGGGVAVRVIRVEAEIGHAEAWTLGAHQSGGRILVFAEPSLEFGPEVLEALASGLAEPGDGLAGPFGLARRGERDFEPASGPEVDALEYLLAMRRADLARVGDFDAHYRYYRILDIDFSHQVRAAGLRVRTVDSPPVVRHEHRLWAATPALERERLSKRNFNRFLDRWVRSRAPR